jgi:hypothetical protein
MMMLTVQSPRRRGEGPGNLGYLLNKSELNYTGSDVCMGIYIYIYIYDIYDIYRWSVLIISRSYMFLLIRKMPVTYAFTSDKSNGF